MHSGAYRGGQVNTRASGWLISSYTGCIGTDTHGFDDHLHAKGPGPEQTYPAPHGLLLPSLLLSAPANVLSGLCWGSLTSASIFQLDPSFKALLERHHLQTSSRIPPRWKQFPPPLNILRCLCFSYCSPHAYLLLHKHFCLCLTSPTGRELLES